MGALTRDVVGTPPPAMAKYEWLRVVLLEHINERLRPGDPVPSERELADELDVSRMTARRALNALVSEGRIRRVPGLGSFVNEPTILLPIQLTSFTTDMNQRGYTSGAQTLSQSVGSADEEVAARLGIGSGTPVLTIVRLRSADLRPVAIERVHLVAGMVPGLEEVDLTDRSLYAVLADRFGLILDGGQQTITARAAEPEDASRLQMAPGSPVLHLARTTTSRGRIVEFTASIYRGDRYELTTRL
ncbi:MAG: GntR family transcriptional regulator [Actinomycetales bacterium]